MRTQFVIPVVLLLALGCKGGHSVVGIWKVESATRTIPAVVTSEIKSDGTFKTTNVVENAKTGLTATIVDSGSWTLAGNTMTIHFTDSEWSFQGPPALVQRMQQREVGRKEEFLKKLNVHPTSTIAWNGDDAFTMTDSDGTVEKFQRVKG